MHAVLVVLGARRTRVLAHAIVRLPGLPAGGADQGRVRRDRGRGRVMVDPHDPLFGPDDLQAAACELAERTAAEQGLPLRVKDHVVLERVARLAGDAATE